MARYGPGMIPLPTCIVVMGVSGSGKTTVAERLAARLGCPYEEGDDHHPAANVAKMRAGTPLDDDDRRPWLLELAAWIGAHEAEGRSCVLTCSALKRSYRELLCDGHPSVWFAHVSGPQELITVGHGRLDRGGLGSLLSSSGIELLVDVRRYPGSRANPDVARDALVEWVPELGIDYRWEERLGGRRRLPPGEPVADGWWTVAQFAAYAAHTRTPEFGAALDEVLAAAGGQAVAVMCSESVWWRCHRRLIADVAVLGRGVPVTHLMPDGRLRPHEPSPGAVLGSDGAVRWP